MGSADNFSLMREDLLDSLYASASEVPAWESFTRVARDIFHCDQAAVMVDSNDRDMPVGIYADDALAGPIDALFEQGVAAFPHSEPFLIATDGGDALVLAVTDACQRGAKIVLWRAGRRTAFSAETLKLLASLANPLRRSLDIYYRIVDLARGKRVGEIALETSRIGVAVLSIDGSLLLANSVMDHLLSMADGLRLTHGKLHLERADDTSALLAEIRRCALIQSADDDPQLYTPMSFERRHCSLPLTAVVRPGAGFHPLRRPLRRSAILVVRDPTMQAPWSAQTLAQLFGLTSAEALLASELAKGANLNEAANCLGVSRNTVRTQLQGIFMKTGTNRQSDLIRALLNSVATST